ncbi:MAG: leucine-rich repeat protein [Clostridia bacterium]
MKKVKISIFILVILLFATCLVSCNSDHEHSYGRWTTTRESTCTKEGEREHSCVDCGHTEKQALPLAKHDGSNLKCQICIEHYSNEATHSSLDWVYEEIDGVAHNIKHCAKCDYNYEDIIVTKGLTYVEVDGGVEVIGAEDQKIKEVYVPYINEKGQKVVSIASQAFDGYKDIVEVSIPSELNHLGKFIFTNTRWWDRQQTGIVYLNNWLLGYKSQKPIGSLEIESGTVGIADEAFYSCTTLTGKLTIPNSVKHIGERAFTNCQFTSIEVDSGNLAYKSLGNCLIDINSKTLILGCLGSVIPNTTDDFTKIGDYAFFHCVNQSGKGINFTNIILPNGLISIGKYAFAECSGLTNNLILPNSLIDIGEGAFSKCSSLVGVTLPNAITEIKAKVFENCTKLSGELIIPKNITKIGDRAFYSCSSLTSLSLHDGLTQLGEEAFSRASSLNGTLIIPSSITAILARTFSYCGYDVITLNGNLDCIGEGAFFNCGNLKSIIWNNKISTIGTSAFANCVNLEGKLDLPNSISFLGANAFSNCEKLTSVDLPTKIDKISDGLFSNCTGLSGKLVLPDGILSIGAYAFYNCKNLIGELTIPNSVTAVLDCAFQDCTGFTKLNMSSCIKEIGQSAYDNCSGLVGEISLSGTLIEIRKEAFHNCTGVTLINIPSSVQIVGSNAFMRTGWWNSQPNNMPVYLDGWLIGYRGERLSGDFVLDASAFAIAERALASCDKLTRILIPNTIKYIMNDAFSGCDSLVIYANVKLPSQGWLARWNANSAEGFCTTVMDCTFDSQNTYLISFVVSQTNPYGQLEIDPTRQGYIFEGWFDNAECTGDKIKNIYFLKDDTRVYAKWTKV